ncbi:hypothetical protein IRJ41_017461, partial [Triplophysa rosa]
TGYWTAQQTSHYYKIISISSHQGALEIEQKMEVVWAADSPSFRNSSSSRRTTRVCICNDWHCSCNFRVPTYSVWYSLNPSNPARSESVGKPAHIEIYVQSRDFLTKITNKNVRCVCSRLTSQRSADLGSVHTTALAHFSLWGAHSGGPIRGAAAVLAWHGFTFLQNWLMLDRTQYKVYLKREVPYTGVKADTAASSAGTGFSCNVNISQML